MPSDIMELFPHDLRARHHALLIKRRSYGVRGAATPSGYEGSLEPVPAARPGWLGKIWVKGSGLNEAQASRALPNSSMQTQGSLWGLGATVSFLTGIPVLIAAQKHGLDPALAWSAWLATTAGCFALGGGPLASWAFRSVSDKPLVESELELLSEKAETDLERTFLSLVRDAIRTNLPDPPATEVRRSIAALGEALDSLPEVAPSAVDPAALRAEADGIDALSLAETDRVTSDSHSRRADALRRRAESAERTTLAGKRTVALKAEIRAQMEALREGLAALGADNASAALADLASLAESVRTVAAEAVSALDAEAEIAGISPIIGGQGVIPATEETPMRQTLGR